MNFGVPIQLTGTPMRAEIYIQIMMRGPNGPRMRDTCRGRPNKKIMQGPLLRRSSPATSASDSTAPSAPTRLLALFLGRLPRRSRGQPAGPPCASFSMPWDPDAAQALRGPFRTARSEKTCPVSSSQGAVRSLRFGSTTSVPSAPFGLPSAPLGVGHLASASRWSGGLMACPRLRDAGLVFAIGVEMHWRGRPNGGSGDRGEPSVHPDRPERRYPRRPIACRYRP